MGAFIAPYVYAGDIELTQRHGVGHHQGRVLGAVPSPQSIVVPAKSAVVAAGLASVKVATVVVIGRPSVAVTPLPLLGVKAASLTVAASVALAIEPPSSRTEAFAV